MTLKKEIPRIVIECNSSTTPWWPQFCQRITLKLVSKHFHEVCLFLSVLQKKLQVGNDQEMVQSERNYHSKKRGVGKTKLTLRYLYQEKIS